MALVRVGDSKGVVTPWIGTQRATIVAMRDEFVMPQGQVGHAYKLTSAAAKEAMQKLHEPHKYKPMVLELQDDDPQPLVAFQDEIDDLKKQLETATGLARRWKAKAMEKHHQLVEWMIYASQETTVTGDKATWPSICLHLDAPPVYPNLEGLKNVAVIEGSPLKKRRVTQVPLAQPYPGGPRPSLEHSDEEEGVAV